MQKAITIKQYFVSPGDGFQLEPGLEPDGEKCQFKPVYSGVKTVIVLVLVQIVLVYQGGTYWIIRQRVTARSEDLHY